MDDPQDASAQAVLAGEGFHARRAQFDETEFGGDEKAVEGHEEQRADEREDLYQRRNSENERSDSIRLER
ncbi:hypothetical protein BpKM390_55810 [Burkholderia pseudomallei]|nr:hypothetical protein GTC019_53460 [Burkholderia pseudomallei]BEH28215.1 hypothetical protein GTC050_54670 [Burkholderia pseudomallei]BEH34333.1 hypothetical protein GTC054_55490 [Burkholderia pseudomallei]BEH40221.1 hypothetical protein GTC254T_53160 [Burkholderia pseudomallei]BEH46190.1 hypothetical protein KNG_53910 [Burkholderia pseudomallei]